MKREYTIHDIKNNMLNNAIDYLENAINRYNENDFKYSLMFLWSGLLLFMKLRLFEINPNFIYASLDDIVSINQETLQPGYRKFDCSGNRRTVDFKAILERMAILDSKSAIFKYKDKLERIQRMRNRVEHFVDDFSSEEYLSSLSAALPFINDIIEKELNLEITSLFQNWDEFLSIKEIYDDRKMKMEAIVSAKAYWAHKDGELLNSVDCPYCTDGIMVSEYDNELHCPICGYSAKYVVCSRCGTTFLKDDWSQFNEDTGICDDCFQSICDNSD